ncbi:MAG: SLBB domain-containing protein [Planctomycetes bacterium]|nr:SLBB domain-containing protein [Planctomycetota bacterium]
MNPREPEVPGRIAEAGGLSPGIAAKVHRETGVPEADVFGVGSFYSLLARPDRKVRICQGLSCRLAGSEALLRQALDTGLPAEGCSCLASCDRPCAALRDRTVLPGLTAVDIARAAGKWQSLTSTSAPSAVGPLEAGPERCAIHLQGVPGFEGHALSSARAHGYDSVLRELEASGLQGRGGAGFPAARKWRAVREQAEPTRYLVLNADESEPGAFKDREVLLRRPDLVVEGLAIAAEAVGAREIFCYFRGEFEAPMASVSEAWNRLEQVGLLSGLSIHLHRGHGGYVCGEETALLEALEGRRPWPRHKPPFPFACGLWGNPTLVQNVETIALVPAIVRNGGSWFAALGKTGPGTKLYSISGHVQSPGVYELPLGSTLAEVLDAAGGCQGTLKAFQPGGASSGFLPVRAKDVPLDFESLRAWGTFLGAGGLVVLNDAADLREAVRAQLAFFEHESCGQCAPCRIGTGFLRHAYERWLASRKAGDLQAMRHLQHVDEAAWVMEQGSICGLGQTASLPLTLARKYFPEEFDT